MRCFLADLFANRKHVLQRVTSAVLGGPHDHNNGIYRTLCCEALVKFLLQVFNIQACAKIDLDVDQIGRADSGDSYANQKLKLKYLLPMHIWKYTLQTRMPSRFSSLFKSRTHTPSPVSQSSTTGTPSSSIAAIIEHSENTSIVMDRTAVAVVSQSERVRSTTTPSNTASPAASAAVNTLKFSLQHLGKAPLPGIGVATSALLDIINRIQVSQENIAQETY